MCVCVRVGGGRKKRRRRKGGLQGERCPTNQGRSRGEVKTAKDELVTSVVAIPTPNPPYTDMHTHRHTH